MKNAFRADIAISDYICQSYAREFGDFFLEEQLNTWAIRVAGIGDLFAYRFSA